MTRRAPARAALLVVASALSLAGCSSTAAGPSPTSTPRATSTPAITSTPAAMPSVPTPRPVAARAVAAIPPISARARAAGLRDVRTIVPDAVIDLRYRTVHNFTGQRLYPFNARCLVHRSMAPGLARAAAVLRRTGKVLLFWDCYRPHYAQVHMYRIVPNPNWVAKPGRYARSHEAARSVDITMASRSTTAPCPTSRAHGHCLADMGTGFDNFTPRAFAYATKNVSARAERNRANLRKAMGTGGLTVYSGEWWHFDGPGAAVNRPFLQAPLS